MSERQHHCAGCTGKDWKGKGAPFGDCPGVHSPEVEAAVDRNLLSEAMFTVAHVEALGASWMNTPNNIKSAWLSDGATRLKWEFRAKAVLDEYRRLAALNRKEQP